MITWLQKTFQEHFRYVFIALLVCIIIAFVFINNASLGLGLFESRSVKRPFFGVNLADAGTLDRIVDDAAISVFFQFGSKPPRNEHLQQIALKRHALVCQANRLRMPLPTAQEVETHIRTLRYFRNDEGKFDNTRYLYFRASPKTATDMKLTEGDFMRVVADDLRIDRLQKLIAGPGYVLPSEIRQILKQNETTWTFVTATVEQKAPSPTLDPADGDVARFFEQNRERYAIAPQVRVDAIEFESARFLESVNVTEEEVRAYYDANPARFPKPVSGAASPQSHDAHYELVRPNAQALLRQQRAQALAVTAAGDLLVTLHKGRIIPGTGEFTALLEKSHAAMQPLPAFSKEAPPAQYGRNGATIAKEAFALDAQTRYSNPVATGKNAIILVWQESIPERPAEFVEVGDKVKNDYMQATRQNQLIEMGRRIKQRAEADLKAGLPFQVAITKAAAAEGAGATTKNHAPFSLRRQDARQYGGPNAGAIDPATIQLLQHLKQGEISDMTIKDDAGTFVYAQEVNYTDLTPANPEYARLGVNRRGQTLLFAVTAARSRKRVSDVC